MNDVNASEVKRGFYNILLLGLVSLFIDLSTEMVYPLVTIYLSTFTTVSVVGIIEGFAESIAALLKVYSGYLGDKYQNKKLLAFIGYSSAVVYKILLFFSLSWVGILLARLVDRIGKGIRTSPRDTLVAESGGHSLGKSFGFHKMLDMFGASLGVLIAYFLYLGLVNIESQTITDIAAFKTIFLFSIIPALIGLFCLILVKETRRIRKDKEKFSLKGIKLDNKLKLYLLIVLIFSIGNSSNAFLILRAYSAGFKPYEVLLLYFIYNLAAAIFALPLGKLSDKIGRRNLVVPGYLLYGLIYVGFALYTNQIMMIILFSVYGLYQAVMTGAEKAFITELSPKVIKGTIMGLYGTCQGIGLLLASIIAGALWDHYGPAATFYFGGILGLFAAIFAFIVMSVKKVKASS